jgi:hypothetical protein
MSIIFIGLMLNIDATKTSGNSNEYLVNITYTPTEYISIEGQKGFINIRTVEYVNVSSVSIDNMIITAQPKFNGLFLFFIYLYINLFIFIFIIIYFINDGNNYDNYETYDDNYDYYDETINGSINTISEVVKRLKANKSASLIQALFKGVYFRSNVLPLILEKNEIIKKMIAVIVRQEHISCYQKIVIDTNNNIINSL